ncbi:MAG TPA: hypothetical protein VFN97_02980 [Actinospica sp.]|nr:hypothetical protein [Actinospica sp.]
MADVTPTPILTADPPALPWERSLLDPPAEYAAWREQQHSQAFFDTSATREQMSAAR